jgi:tetratricopeptide (TPR) repeat protein
VEGGLRLAGYGYSPRFFLKRRIAGEAFWTDNQQFGRRFFPAGLQRGSRPLRFAANKPVETIRIFVFGESAAMGDPDFKFGLPRMLEVLLRERFNDRRIEVINAAVVAINSNVILPIARDCVEGQGDLWVIYMGNNEMVGPFGSDSVFGARAPALSVVRAGLWLKGTRLGQLLDRLGQLMRGKQPFSEWTGMEMMADQWVRYDDPATARVYRHFERNLIDILRTGVRTAVPIVLCTVPTNVGKCAPFASLHNRSLSGAQLAEWQAAYDSATARQNEGNLTNALLGFAKAAQIDSDFAGLAFRQAECDRLLGMNAEAEKFFRQARDKDALQFRADSSINSIIRRTATAFAERRVSLLDAESLFATNSPQGLTGNEFFYEHVHLTPEGNYLLAVTIANQIARELSLKTARGWTSQSECFRLLGLTDWNRYDALNTVLDRIQGAPFTNQINHTCQVQGLEEQMARYRLATKPAQVRRQAAQVAELVRSEPADEDLRWNLATLLQSSGDYQGAEEQWRRLMQLQPQSPLPPYNLAKLLEAIGRQAEALPLYQLCLRLEPNNARVRDTIRRLEVEIAKR